MTTAVWIVEDDDSMRWVLERALGQAGFAVTGFRTAEPLLAELATQEPDVVITDIRMPGIDGLDLAARLQRERPSLPVIVMTAHSDLDTTVAAFHEGAFDYLAKPFDLEDAVELVRRAAQSRPAEATPETRAAAVDSSGMVGQSAAMQGLYRAIGRLAHAPIPVLITGESGTGKELVARALHRSSPRAQGPFIGLNMAAIPRELLESELFGHERGAFTGAHQRRQGRFEEAAGGTLFLDEIGDMPASLQTRLLRVLSEGVFHRLGGSEPVRADVRILAATHQDLDALVAAGDFRADLYHRLNVVRLQVPALRERRADIPALARHFLIECARELGLTAKQMSADAAAQLAQHDWPGNVRELENLCRWLTVMAPGPTVEPTDLPEGITADHVAAQTDDWTAQLADWASARIAAGANDIGGEARRAFDRALIRTALNATAGHRQRAAKLLGWGRNTLTRRIQELGLDDLD